MEVWSVSLAACLSVIGNDNDGDGDAMVYDDSDDDNDDRVQHEAGPCCYGWLGPGRVCREEHLCVGLHDGRHVLGREDVAVEVAGGTMENISTTIIGHY